LVPGIEQPLAPERSSIKKAPFKVQGAFFTTGPTAGRISIYAFAYAR
jgi:hypothetical protein